LPGTLRQPGAVLLVSLYELGHQPLQLASPLGFLRAAGFAPQVLDLYAERFAPERVAAAQAILIAVPMHTALRLGLRFLARARAINPQALVAFYGLYATLNAGHLFDQGADAIVGGESESALVALCAALTAAPSGKAELGPIPGVMTRAHPATPVLARLPFVPPARDTLLPLGRYARFDPGDGSERPAGYTEASRGCLHLCRHCPIPPVYGGRFFVVPKDVVLADVRQQVAAGAEHITFGDPDFLNGPRHSLAILRALHAEFPALTFDVTCKVEHILRQRALWPELGQLGVRFVVSAVESLSPTVLTLLHKGHTPEDVEAALGLLQAAGIAMRPSLVAFTPWTTLADYQELLGFVARHDLGEHVDPVQFSIRLLVPPGSHLLQVPELLPHLGPLDEARLCYPWRHPDPRMDELHLQVAARVEAGVAAKEPPLQLLAALFALVRRCAGSPPEAVRLVQSRARASGVPRLTEPWFC
jgi:radical SAM superfamily enzyme YgiQ (UPF0313 family)